MNTKLFNIYIGYDGVESVAWHVMAHSIFSKSSIPVAFIPVSVNNLQGIYNRERDAKQSNEFSFTRFLVPYLNNYQGYAVFFDCDMLVRTDINELVELIKADPGKAVYVVKHDYVPKDTVKYLNTVQYTYPRKNWSSVVVWNCGHLDNKRLTPEFINTATGIELHRFTWLKDEDIGELDVRWNWLVGEYQDPPDDVKNVHWTIGGPYFNEYANSDFAKEWFDGKDKINYCKQRVPK
jgi:lipopolysaccharide biosynthesis glycosyltransferase